MIGLYAGLFLWIAAFTGILIGFEFGEEAIYKITRSEGPTRPAPVAVHCDARSQSDQYRSAMAAARQALPGAAIEIVQLPRNPKGVFFFVLRVPEETTGSPHSTVAVDQYTGKPLQVRDFRTDSRGLLLDPLQPRGPHGGPVRDCGSRDHVVVQPAPGGDGGDRVRDLVEETGRSSFRAPCPA